MAETDDKKNEEDLKAEKHFGAGVLQWILMVVIVAICAGSGFTLGRLFAGSPTPNTINDFQKNEPVQEENAERNDLITDFQKPWYYDLQPVVANLDEAGVTRYVRATLTLEINPELSKKKGDLLLEEKKPILTNWLTIYLAGLTLEDARGDRNLRRIQSQILDAFNEKLFPNAKPQIKRVLFKEFAIQ